MKHAYQNRLSLMFAHIVFATALISIFLHPQQLFSSELTTSTTVLKRDDSQYPRIIEVEYLSPDKLLPCRVLYTKNGIKNQIAQSNNTPDVCEKVELKLIKNIAYAFQSMEHFLKTSAPTPNHAITIDNINPILISELENKNHVLVQALNTYDEASKYIASIKRRYPNINFTVAKSDNALSYPYNVMLATSVTEQEASDIVRKAKKLAIGDPKIIVIESNAWLNKEISLIRSDWQRFAITTCYSEGSNTAKKLAACTGLLVDERQLSKCLHNGVCLPESIDYDKFKDSLDDQLILTIIKLALNEKIVSCIKSDNTEEERIECSLKNMLPEEERLIYDCTQENKNPMDIAGCVVNNEIPPEIVEMMECGEKYSPVSSDLALCALGKVDNETVRVTTKCLANEDPESCFVAELAGEELGQAIECANEHGTDKTATALCIANDYLNEDQRKLVGCAANSGGTASFAVCAAGGSLDLTAEQQIALECATQSGGNPYAFAGCYGYRTTIRELTKCFTDGIGGDGCFGKNNTLVKLGQNAYNDATKGLGKGNELVKAREAFLGKDNGEISKWLRDPGKRTLKITENIAKESIDWVEKRTGIKVQPKINPKKGNAELGELPGGIRVCFPYC